MVKRASQVAAAGALALGLLCPSGSAQAACSQQTVDVSNDLALECLIGPRRAKESSDPTLREQSMYRSLLSELSAVMALPILEPADTVGYSGFHFSFDVTATSVKKDNPYWSGYLQPDGNRSQAGVRHVSGSFLPVATIMLRKGMWTPLPPLPSVELGLGASNLLQSGIFALNGYFKLALHEGYHDLPIPSLALRASVSRIAGAPQVDLTVITAEGQVSKAFGVGGTFTLEPYVGGGVLFSIVRSQVIDTAPTIDLYRGPSPLPPTGYNPAEALAQKTVFPTQDDIMRWRVFGGINLHYAIVSLTGYFGYFGVGADNGYDVSTLPTPANTQAATSGAAACRTDKTTNANVCPKDLAGDQFQVGGSLGLRF